MTRLLPTPVRLGRFLRMGKVANANGSSYHSSPEILLAKRLDLFGSLQDEGSVGLVVEEDGQRQVTDRQDV